MCVTQRRAYAVKRPWVSGGERARAKRFIYFLGRSFFEYGKREAGKE